MNQEVTGVIDEYPAAQNLRCDLLPRLAAPFQKQMFSTGGKVIFKHCKALRRAESERILAPIDGVGRSQAAGGEFIIETDPNFIAAVTAVLGCPTPVLRG
jgi:hypothetical protein